MRYEPAKNADLNGVELENGRTVAWADAFPRNYAEQFRGIEPGSVPEYRPD